MTYNMALPPKMGWTHQILAIGNLEREGEGEGEGEKTVDERTGEVYLLCKAAQGAVTSKLGISPPNFQPCVHLFKDEIIWIVLLQGFS